MNNLKGNPSKYSGRCFDRSCGGEHCDLAMNLKNLLGFSDFRTFRGLFQSYVWFFLVSLFIGVLGIGTLVAFFK